MSLQILIILCFVGAAMGANILVLMPLPFRSHTRTYMPLFKELALRGHNVTFVSPIPFKEDIPNLKMILVTDFLTSQIESNVMQLDPDDTNGWRHILFMWRFGVIASEGILAQPAIKELIHTTESPYDIILLETFYMLEPLVAFGHKFNIPVINLHPFRAENWINFNLGNPNPFSYVPNFRLEIDEHMNFFERFANVMVGLFHRLSGHFYYLPKQEKIMRKYFNYPGSETLPSLSSMLSSTHLTLADGSHAISFIAPNLPSVITVGGIHLSKSAPLPKDLEEWINNSPDGIIYLSLGSMIRSADLKPEHLSVFIKVLGSLPQRVLWKWEDAELPNKPINIKTSNWLPQQAILAHPKCRLFLTHGGFHSLFEAAHFGVPIVGTPIFADQRSNLHIAQKKGYGRMIKFSNFTVDSLSSAINTVLNDPSFRKNAQKLSSIIRDEPMTAMQRAVFWVEHVIRHKGAEHLKSGRQFLKWYEHLLLDIAATILLVVILIYVITKKIVSKLYSLLFTKAKAKEIKQKNKVKKN